MTTACTADVQLPGNRPDGNRESGALASGRVGGDAFASASELLKITDLVYEGAFRVPAKANGSSDMNYSQGPIAYAADSRSVFLVGHAHQQAVAEYLVPEIINSKSISKLNMAQPVQEFNPVLSRMAGGNPEKLNRLGGLAYHDGRLMISAYEYYDAPADNVTTHLVVEDARNLSGSVVTGPLSFEGRAHTSGWMSPIPVEWQAALGGRWLTGSSSGEPIIGRLSVGPSAFAFDPEDMNNKTSKVSTTMLLDFSLKRRLHEDLSNEFGDNDIWTHLSRAVYGFIPPGSRSYITIGHSGGHSSSVCYKCIPKGRKANCPGYCASEANDYALMYWLWDVQDLVDVRNGDKPSYSVYPYDHGVFEAPFAAQRIGGGSYDPASNRLYITLQRADNKQGPYANTPIILVYSIAGSALN